MYTIFTGVLFRSLHCRLLINSDTACFSTWPVSLNMPLYDDTIAMVLRQYLRYFFLMQHNIWQTIRRIAHWLAQPPLGWQMSGSDYNVGSMTWGQCGLATDRQTKQGWADVDVISARHRFVLILSNVEKRSVYYLWHCPDTGQLWIYFFTNNITDSAKTMWYWFVRYL